MISEATFVELMRDLGDDLVSPSGRHEAVHRRIRRVRRRRAAVAGAVAVLLVAAGLVLARPNAPETAAEKATPVSWVAEDGVTYRRIAASTLDTPDGKAITVTLPSSTAIAVLATCEPGLATTPPPIGVTPDLPEISVQLGSQPPERRIECGDVSQPKLIDYDVTTVAKGKGSVTVTLSATPPTITALVPESILPAVWTFGFYVWDVPAALRPAPALPPMPARQNGYALQSSHVGVWPMQSVTFAVPKGVTWGVLVTCSSAFAGAYSLQNYEMWDLTVNGDIGASTPCDGVERVPSNETPFGNAFPNAPAATGLTVVLTFHYDPIYNLRSGSWLVGVYYRISS